MWFQTRLLRGGGIVSGQSGKKSYPHVPLFSHNMAQYFKNQDVKLPVVVILKERSTSKPSEPDVYHMQSLQRLKRSCFACDTEGSVCERRDCLTINRGFEVLCHVCKLAIGPTFFICDMCPPFIQKQF